MLPERDNSVPITSAKGIIYSSCFAFVSASGLSVVEEYLFKTWLLFSHGLIYFV